jgi:hypothetical protein
VAQYIGETKLEALGFKREENWFVLRKECWVQSNRRLELVEVGRLKLDAKGYIVDSRKFEKLKDGKVAFVYMSASW